MASEVCLYWVTLALVVICYIGHCNRTFVMTEVIEGCRMYIRFIVVLKQ